MFKKTFKIKSNTQLKVSERKNFKELLLKSFSNFTEDKCNEFIQKKDVINCIKISTWDDDIVFIYTVQKRPMIFDFKGKIYPTVYLLWKFPDLIYSFTTHPQVMSNISSGADLLLPGVVVPGDQTDLSRYGNLKEGDIVFVNLTNNKAAIAVGDAFQSSSSMVYANGRGKCVTIHHFYGDKLCNLDGLQNLPVPNLGPVVVHHLKSYDEDFPELGSKKDVNKSAIEVEESASEVEETINDKIVSENIVVESIDDMDDLLYYCFMTAIKYSKTLTLPVLTSNFYKLQILPNCPPDKTLDIKKTSYKKLKPFLEKMCQRDIIKIKEIKKGVESISAINKENPEFAQFYVIPENRPKKDADLNCDNQLQANVSESYIITQNVLPIFASAGYQKNDTISPNEVRKLVTQYVKDNNCQDAINSRLIKPDPILTKICRTDNSITWEELIEKTIDTMKDCFKVSVGGDDFINKGKISPITLSVSVRSGNKKVTLVDNLELFGIRLQEFAKECQHGVAASTSISKPPGKKTDQLLVQGNQVLFIYNLLTEKYKIPKRYVKGLENAPKKKK